MSYILYRYKIPPKESAIQYVKKIHNGKIYFTSQAMDAKHFALFTAIFLSFKFGLSWISRRYVR